MSEQHVQSSTKLSTGFYRLSGADENRQALYSDTLSSVLSAWKSGEEGFLVLVPHDDDAVVGMGMVLQHLTQCGLPLLLAVVTDGRLGYTSLEDRTHISEIRHRETLQSCEVLGITPSQVHWLGFPDGDLDRYRGKRLAAAGDPTSADGYTGLEDAFVRLLRRGIEHKGKTFPITRIFFPAASDYHNDHIVSAEQIMISVFHAQGIIWPECGTPITHRPYCYQFSVYCDFSATEPANLLYRGSEDHWNAKIRSIMAYESQGQIAALVDSLKKEGPYELFREVEFRLASRERQLAPFLNRSYTTVS
jgi:LmbE family N-acetylglucosaminyl deacetylase